MHGIPVLIKDNIDTHDRMMTTAGSLALLGSIAPSFCKAGRLGVIARSGTLTLAQLQQYQIVVPLGSNPFLDGDTLGNNLADYVDGGGIVVQYGFSFYGPGQPFGINGRWVSGN